VTSISTTTTTSSSSNSNVSLDNFILECRYCGEFVHKNCYINHPIEYVNEFICERCCDSIDKEYSQQEDSFNKTKCVFCYKDRGITVKFTKDKWTHITCLRWLLNMKSVDVVFKSNFDYEMILPEWRKLNKCDLCRGYYINDGVSKYVIKCGVESCYFYMHVNCAIDNSCIFKLSEMERVLSKINK
jgi:hypothetical protein